MDYFMSVVDIEYLETAKKEKFSKALAEISRQKESFVRAIYSPDSSSVQMRMMSSSEEQKSFSILMSSDPSFTSFSVIRGSDLIGADTLSLNDISSLSRDGGDRLMIFGNTELANTLKAFQKLSRDFEDRSPSVLMEVAKSDPEVYLRPQEDVEHAINAYNNPKEDIKIESESPQNVVSMRRP